LLFEKWGSLPRELDGRSFQNREFRDALAAAGHQEN